MFADLDEHGYLTFSLVFLSIHCLYAWYEESIFAYFYSLDPSFQVSINKFKYVAPTFSTSSYVLSVTSTNVKTPSEILPPSSIKPEMAVNGYNFTEAMRSYQVSIANEDHYVMGNGVVAIGPDGKTYCYTAGHVVHDDYFYIAGRVHSAKLPTSIIEEIGYDLIRFPLTQPQCANLALTAVQIGQLDLNSVVTICSLRQVDGYRSCANMLRSPRPFNLGKSWYAEYDSQPGDSGAGIFQGKKLVGIHIGADTTACKNVFHSLFSQIIPKNVRPNTHRRNLFARESDRNSTVDYEEAFDAHDFRNMLTNKHAFPKQMDYFDDDFYDMSAAMTASERDELATYVRNELDPEYTIEDAAYREAVEEAAREIFSRGHAPRRSKVKNEAALPASEPLKLNTSQSFDYTCASPSSSIPLSGNEQGAVTPSTTLPTVLRTSEVIPGIPPRKKQSKPQVQEATTVSPLPQPDSTTPVAPVSASRPKSVNLLPKSEPVVPATKLPPPFVQPLKPTKPEISSASSTTPTSQSSLTLESLQALSSEQLELVKGLISQFGPSSVPPSGNRS